MEKVREDIKNIEKQIIESGGIPEASIDLRLTKQVSTRAKLKKRGGALNEQLIKCKDAITSFQCL